jgi:hypothetical protein
MLSKKLSKKPVLTVVKKSRLRVVSEETAIPEAPPQTGPVQNALPERNDFNSGYLKPKKHDPL